MYVQVHVSQCRRTCNQIWTVAHVHAGNYESVRSVNCGVELQKKILETCPCFLFSCFMYSIHFISTFLVLLPRVTSWWRTTRVTMVSPVPTIDFEPRTPPPVRYHVEVVSWRPNPAFCTFDLHEFWSHSTHTICLTPYRVWETSCRIINTLNFDVFICS